uniref:BPL/LPL catalytic domain-containing protein n=1 Tax=Romanomermis culicivorax TaxID=13658 RepID=A0A915II82_ROMCU
MSRIQTAGKGRVKNCWLSPKGCAMFTFGYTVEMESNLAKMSSYFQHLCVIAVVDALRSITGFENLDVRIKWPNDIYYGRTVKIGGMIVNCTMKNNSFEFTTGVGLNVANSRPTLCINDVLPKDVEPFSCEQIIALILSKVEEFIEKFQEKGYESILPLYYKYWLHEYQELTLADTKEQVVVRGLDQYGFLQVRSRKSGKLISLQPDGNSLDMMHNLLRVKDDS